MPAPKYRRLGKEQSGIVPAIEANPDQTLHTAEDFRSWLFTSAGGAPDPPTGVDTGILHRFNLPPTSTRRYVWIAAGAHFHGAQSDLWFIQGSLNFFRGGRPVGFVLFGDACQQSAGVAAQQDAAMRKITRIAPDGNGSVQPSLRYQESVAAVVRNNLDMGCVEVPVLADRAEYACQASRIVFNSVALNQIRILTGCRIISVP